MALEQVKVTNVRNICATEIETTSHINAFFGQNGSGKSSLLEAIHLLSQGRSYRSLNPKNVIQYTKDEMTVYGKLATSQGRLALGIQKTQKGETTLRINGVTQASIATLAQALPVIVLEHDSLRVLDAGAKERRHLIDWGAFHYLTQSGQAFFSLWRAFNRVLKQRNAALRLGDFKQAQSFDEGFIKTAESLSRQRIDYLEKLQTDLMPIINRNTAAIIAYCNRVI